MTTFLHERSSRSACVGWLAVIVLALSGCAAAPISAPDAVQLPLLTAWYEGRVIRYVTTDVSDAAVARAKGVNYAPRLAEVLPEAAGADRRAGSPLERVYAFVDRDQPTVFPSIPRPVGPDSADKGYTPLWRMVQVRWKPGSQQAELKSEEEILAAEDRGDVQLTLTNVVLNCPVLWAAGDPPLRGVTLLRAAAAR